MTSCVAMLELGNGEVFLDGHVKDGQGTLNMTSINKKKDNNEIELRLRFTSVEGLDTLLDNLKELREAMIES